MPVQDRKKNPQIIFLIFLIILLDQFTKYIIKKSLPVGTSIPVIKNVLHLTSVRNFGAAFGILKNQTLFFIFISSFSIVFILSMFLYDRKSGLIKNLSLRIAMAMILAGAIGNFIDRVKFGYVIDFIDVRIWPVFNIADTFITIGAILLLFEMMRGTGGLTS